MYTKLFIISLIIITINFISESLQEDKCSSQKCLKIKFVKNRNTSEEEIERVAEQFESYVNNNPLLTPKQKENTNKIIEKWLKYARNPGDTYESLNEKIKQLRALDNLFKTFSIDDQTKFSDIRDAFVHDRDTLLEELHSYPEYTVKSKSSKVTVSSDSSANALRLRDFIPPNALLVKKDDSEVSTSYGSKNKGKNKKKKH